MRCRFFFKSVVRVADSWNRKRVIDLDSGFEWAILSRTSAVLSVSGWQRAAWRSLLSIAEDRVHGRSSTGGHSRGAPWHVESDNGFPEGSDGKTGRSTNPLATRLTISKEARHFPQDLRDMRVAENRYTYNLTNVYSVRRTQHIAMLLVVPPIFTMR